MSKDERKEMIENIAERFTQMDDVDKSYIAGYMACLLYTSPSPRDTS